MKSPTSPPFKSEIYGRVNAVLRFFSAVSCRLSAVGCRLSAEVRIAKRESTRLSSTPGVSPISAGFVNGSQKACGGLGDERNFRLFLFVFFSF